MCRSIPLLLIFRGVQVEVHSPVACGGRCQHQLNEAFRGQRFPGRYSSILLAKDSKVRPRSPNQHQCFADPFWHHAKVCRRTSPPNERRSPNLPRSSKARAALEMFSRGIAGTLLSSGTLKSAVPVAAILGDGSDEDSAEEATKVRSAGSGRE